jgi:hypothetical protein
MLGIGVGVRAAIIVWRTYGMEWEGRHISGEIWIIDVTDGEGVGRCEEKPVDRGPVGRCVRLDIRNTLTSRLKTTHFVAVRISSPTDATESRYLYHQYSQESKHIKQ